MAVELQHSAAESCRRDEDSDDDYHEATFFSRGCCCNFCSFPCYSSRKSDSWERISTPEKESQLESGGGNWWGEGIKALKKARELSELAAGPKWKTFIRRFNRTSSRQKPGKFQYDPMSYALNFDEGPAKINGQFEDDDRVFRDFSSRFAAIPVQNSQVKEVPSCT